MWVGLLCVLGAASPARAQTGVIVGRVMDVESSAPLADVSVEVLSAGGALAATAVTDRGGTFRAADLPPGTYALVVTLIGYETMRVDGVQVRAGQTANVEVRLASRIFLLNPLVITASRRTTTAEKALSAPAHVSVIEGRAVAERPAPTPVEYLRSAPGVDIITYGLQGANVVTRGFNNIFSGALHMLQDYRLAHVPSLRVNLMHLIPVTGEDVERIEVVLGPGSALYGPNTANGVLHVITKSPLDYQGTTVSVAGGEQSVLNVGFRTSQLLSETFGFKLSGEYLSAQEWVYRDPGEQEARRQADADPEAFRRRLSLLGLSQEEINRRFARIAGRDFDIGRWSLEARADWRPAPDFTAVFSVGRSTEAKGIELTGLGAAQASGWAYTYYQARASYRRLFGQLYLNSSDAGDTYTLKDGESIVDRSKLFVAQLQHGFSVGERQTFTYGADLILTVPESEGTIYGKNEPDNDMTEVGGYVQSETRLSPKFDLVLTARLDNHSELSDPVFSPRAGLVFRPREEHNFRVTYNRAFSTPTAINLFLDKSGGLARGEVGTLGFLIRGQGTTSQGFRFRNPDRSLTGMRSPFTPLAAGGPRQLLPANAATLLQFWPAAVDVVALQAARAGQPLPSPVVAYLKSLRPGPEQVGMAVLNPITRTVEPLATASIPEVPPIEESLTSTLELGYHGILGDRLLLAADVWFSRHSNFVSPLIPQTPLLLYNGQQLGAYLVPRLVPVLQQFGLPRAQAEATAKAIAAGMAEVPLAVVSSERVNATGADILVTYRNFGEVDLWGGDLSAKLLLGKRWSVGVTGSFVNKDHLRIPLEGQEQIVALNAPKRKGTVTLGYRNVATGLNGELRVRYTGGFPANSADYVGMRCIGVTGPGVEDCVAAFTLLDLTLGYRIPRLPGVTAQLSVSNLLDEGYRSFVGVPAIGRLGLFRLKWEF